MSKVNLNKHFFGIAILLTGILLGIFWWLHIKFIYAYLIAISIISFLFYGYDKRQAIKNNIRIPELILHILALIGGTPGAFLGQFFFGHKTKKLKFRIVFFIIVLFQACILFYYWRYLRKK